MCFEGVPARPYISKGTGLHEKSKPSTVGILQIVFLCTAASSTPIRVVTREIRYIHELSLTLEYSMTINSPADLGLTILSESNNQNHDPFTEFHRHNDGHFSSKFYKIFSEVVFQHVKYISFHLSFHFIVWSSTYSIGSQVFQQETNMRANDIEVHSNAYLSFI